MSVDNLKDDLIRDLVRRVHILETMAPVGYTSVTEGALRIASAEGLLVEGSARITGVLNGDGTITWTGPANFNGDTALKGNMTVSGGGKITIGGLTLDPLAGFGGQAGRISASVVVSLVAPLVNVSADLDVRGAATAETLTVYGATDAQGSLRNSGITSKSGVTSNVWVDPANGRFYRII